MSAWTERTRHTAAGRGFLPIWVLATLAVCLSIVQDSVALTFLPAPPPTPPSVVNGIKPEMFPWFPKFPKQVYPDLSPRQPTNPPVLPRQPTKTPVLNQPTKPSILPKQPTNLPMLPKEPTNHAPKPSTLQQSTIVHPPTQSSSTLRSDHQPSSSTDLQDVINSEIPNPDFSFADVPVIILPTETPPDFGGRPKPSWNGIRVKTGEPAAGFLPQATDTPSGDQPAVQMTSGIEERPTHIIQSAGKSTTEQETFASTHKWATEPTFWTVRESPWALSSQDLKWWFLGVGALLVIIMIIMLVVVFRVVRKKTRTQPHGGLPVRERTATVYSGTSSQYAEHRFSFPTADGPTGYTDIRPCTPLAQQWRSRGFSVSSQRSNTAPPTIENNTYNTITRPALLVNTSLPPPLPPKPASLNFSKVATNPVHTRTYSMALPSPAYPHHGVVRKDTLQQPRLCQACPHVGCTHIYSNDPTPCSTQTPRIKPLSVSCPATPYTWGCGGCAIHNECIHDHHALTTIPSSEIVDTSHSGHLLATLDHARRIASGLSFSEPHGRVMQVVSNRHCRGLDDSDDSLGYIHSQERPLPPIPTDDVSTDEGVHVAAGASLNRERKLSQYTRHQRKRSVSLTKSSGSFHGRPEQRPDHNQRSERTARVLQEHLPQSAEKEWADILSRCTEL